MVLSPISLMLAFVSLQQADPPRDRAGFAKAIGRITPGTPAKDIEALLGKPDDIRTHRDPSGIDTVGTREIWGYGSNGRLGFPTLGQVFIDNDGKAQYVYGGRGVPPDARLFEEDTLRSLLRLIDRAPDFGGWAFDPIPIIEIVNTLQPLGKDKALAAMDEYLRVAPDFGCGARDGLFLILRVLFEIPKDPGHLPPMSVGAPDPKAPSDPTRIPRFPMAVLDDIPILLINGYTVAGLPEPVSNHLAYFRTHGRLRSAPLTPPDNPFDTLDKLEKSPEWPHAPGDGWADHGGRNARSSLPLRPS